MRRCRSIVYVTAICLILAAPSALAAPPPEEATEGRQPLTVRVNLLRSDQLVLDPAFSQNYTSWSVIEQLFLGLVDFDDETNVLQPELATEWTVSTDGLEYTFTLRTDAKWSDGTAVTAHDAAYSLLRTLDPATGAPWAWLFYFIKNGQAYNEGTITDPSQVGVAAMDNSHLRIRLESRASYALSILGHTAARPLPQHVVQTWGQGWTAPENIVTNGPYLLSEWVPDSHLVFDKNPDYYDAASVQIERIAASRLDEEPAWQRYVAGQLDTALVPTGTQVDPSIQPQVHLQPRATTYYYGFSTAQAPFDNNLVRKAFCAALDRQGLINTVLGGGPAQPALTLTAAGVYGHIDGQTEGVGIRFDPTQAQQWLADAGYAAGQGLPPITLWHPDSPGHQAVAQYVRQSWIDHLGVTVSLESLPWGFGPGQYLPFVNSGQAQVWRGGWTAGYNDAYDFLSGAVLESASAFGGWLDPIYVDLLEQAAGESEPAARRDLYKQAEHRLVEDEAVVLPIYYYARWTAAKPYLQRTFPGFEAPDLATWRMLAHRILLPIIVRNYLQP